MISYSQNFEDVILKRRQYKINKIKENIKNIRKVIRAKPRREFIGHNYSGDTFSIVSK